MSSLPEAGSAPRGDRWFALAALLFAIACGDWFMPDEPPPAEVEPAASPAEPAVTPLAAEFDRATHLLLRGDDYRDFVADADAPALAHLDTLATAAGNSMHYRKSDYRRVLFVRAGEREGRRWMAFACIDREGLEVFGFQRDDSGECRYERPIETRRFLGPTWKSPRPRFELVEVRRNGDDVQTVVTVEGVRNLVDWWIRPTTNIAPIPTQTFGPQLFQCAAMPRTGWLDESNWWWPQFGEFQLLEGPSADRALTVNEGPFTIATLDDGRVVAASPKCLELVDPKSGARTMHRLPERKEFENERYLTLSRNGRWCFAHEPGLLLDTLSGNIQATVKIVGSASICFPDDARLVVTDNIQVHEVGCASGSVKDSPVTDRRRFKTDMVGDLIASTHHGGRDVTVVDAQGNPKGSFAEVQGLHQLGLSADGRHLALKGQDGLRVFEIASQRMLFDHDFDNDFHTARSRIKWSRDGRLGAAAGNRYVYVWTLTAPHRFVRFPHGCSGYWPDVAFSADGKSMYASAAGTKSISYWPDLEAALHQAE